MGKSTNIKSLSKKEADREFVLDKAATLFRRNGFERTTVKEVAQACNMLPGSLHYRYSTKEALLLDLMKLGLEKVTNEVFKAGLGHPNLEDQAREYINAHLRVLVSETDMVYVLLFEWRSLEGDARKEMLQLRDRYEQLWATILSLLSEKGFIREDIDIHLLRLIGLGALNWVATWFKEDGEFTLEEVGNTIWKIISTGIVKKP